MDLPLPRPLEYLADSVSWRRFLSHPMPRFLPWDWQENDRALSTCVAANSAPWVAEQGKRTMGPTMSSLGGQWPSMNCELICLDPPSLFRGSNIRVATIRDSRSSRLQARLQPSRCITAIPFRN